MADPQPVDPSVVAQVREIEARAHERWVAGDLDGALGAYADGIALCEDHDIPQLRFLRAGMLANRAKALRRLGRHAEAMLAGELAVEALRPLAREHPAHLQVPLGRALYGQIDPVRRVAGRAAAMKVLDEAVDELRTAAEVAPGEGREWLAYALRWRARQWHRHGGGPARRDVAASLALFRELAADAPAFRRQVARTLRLQARVDPAEAGAALRDALELYRDLAADDPDRHLPDVAVVLSALVDRDHVAAPAHARAHLDEMIEIRRRMEERAPGGHAMELAAALLRRSRRPLASSDEQALADAREARRRWERLAEHDPEHHATWAVEARRVESAILQRTGDRAGALTVARDAVDRARALAGAQDPATLWMIVTMEDLVLRVVVSHGYAAAVPMLDELVTARRRYRPAPDDERRSLPRTPMVRSDWAPEDDDDVSGIVLDPALFGPLSSGQGMAESLLVLSDERDAARRAVAAAARRMALVDETGREHPSADAVEVAYTEGLYTPNFVSDAIEDEAGVRLFADVKGEDLPPIAGRWRQILRDELPRAGVTRAHVIPEPFPADGS